MLGELDRLAHWVGREEPRRAELWGAVDEIKRCLDDGRNPHRAVLRCAVAVRGLWSTALKRLLDKRVRELHALAGGGEAHHAA